MAETAAHDGAAERTGEAPTPLEPPPGGTAGPRRPTRSQIAKVLAAVGAVVAVLTQAAGLIDWIGDKFGDTPPAIVAPRIVSVERQSASSLRDYLNDAAEPRTGYSADELEQMGFVFALTMHIQGEKGSRFGLRWFIVDADTGIRLRGPSFNQVPAVFKPRNQDQTRTYPVWIPTPQRSGTYEVTFALLNADGQPVAQKLAAPFRVTSPSS